MKSSLNMNADRLKKVKFPSLFKKVDSQLVVLFNEDECGTVVVADEGFPLGDWNSAFPSVYNTEIWQRLPSGSQVILTQE